MRSYLLCCLLCVVAQTMAIPNVGLVKRAPTTMVMPLTQVSTKLITNVQTYTSITSNTVSNVVTLPQVQTVVTTIPVRLSSTVPSTSTSLETVTETSTITTINTSINPVIKTLTLATVYPTTNVYTWEAPNNQYSAFSTTMTTEVYQYSRETVVQNFYSTATSVYNSFQTFYTQVASVLDLGTTQVTFSQLSLTTSTHPSVFVTSYSTTQWVQIYFVTYTSTSTATLTTQLLSTIPSTGTYMFTLSSMKTDLIFPPTTVDSTTMLSTSVETITSTNTLTHMIPTSAVEYEDSLTVQVYNETVLRNVTQESIVYSTSEYTSTQVSTLVVTKVTMTTATSDIPESSSAITSISLAPFSDSMFSFESSVDTSVEKGSSALSSPVVSSSGVQVGWNSTSESEIAASKETSWGQSSGLISNSDNSEQLPGISPRTGSADESRSTPSGSIPVLESSGASATPVESVEHTESQSISLSLSVLDSSLQGEAGIEQASPSTIEVVDNGSPTRIITVEDSTTTYISVVTISLGGLSDNQQSIVIDANANIPASEELVGSLDLTGSVGIGSQGIGPVGGPVTITTTISGEAVLDVFANSDTVVTASPVIPPLNIATTLSRFSPTTPVTLPEYGNHAVGLPGPVLAYTFFHLIIYIL